MELATLTDDIKGDIFRPGDPGYDEARMVINSMIDRRPALIARPIDEDGVAAVVTLAREEGLPLAVRCGGHGVSGHGTCDDGILLDLGGLKRIEIDPAGKLVRAGGGLTWGEPDAPTPEHERAGTGGGGSATGLGGPTPS